MKIKTKNQNLSSKEDSKPKEENYSRHNRAKLLNFPVNFVSFSVWFLAFYLLVPMSLIAVADQPSPEQLDPTNLLMPYLAEPSPNDINTASVTMQIVKSQHKKLTQPQIINNIASINFAAKINKELSQNSLPVTDDQGIFLKRQLWQANITIPKAPLNTTNKNELQDIIDQIRSVEFELKSKTAQPVIVVEPVHQTEPNEISSVTETPEETRQIKQTKQSQIQSELLYEPVSNETLQIIEDLLQHPEQLNNPFELAEVLFYSGHLKNAVACYRQALSRSNSDENRPWILFQIANCLQSDDPTTAAKRYRQLITEHPGSAWTNLANAREQLILWYQQDDPKTLIEENQP
ncbi:MAG: tetratricopeptide repeat protein [Planctomycetota bacterium]